MVYKELMPTDALRSLVKCYWFYENSDTNETAYTIIPDGCFDLIIVFEQRSSAASLTGLWTRQVDVTLPGTIKMAAIRFKPLAAEYLLNISISSLLDTEREEDLAWWNLAGVSLTLPEEVVKAFDTALMERVRGLNKVDKRKEALFRILEETHGKLRVSEYSELAYWTSRQINRYFQQWFGVSLKTYCSILRCYAACKELHRASSTENYYDQSHFIKDVQRFAGSPPSALQKNKNDRFLQLATLMEK